LIFGECLALWLEKKKIGEFFQVQFGEKIPNNGKNRHSFKAAKLEKTKTTGANTNTSTAV
jgi:hypothetical protein